MKTSATPWPSPNSLKSTLSTPKPPPPCLGTLWTLHGSPFSTAVDIAIAHSGIKVLTLPFIPVVSSFSMFFRLGPFSAFQRKKVTAPILRVRDGRPRYICDSIEIAMYVDTKRQPSTPSLFPSEHLATIVEFNHKAALLNWYMRGKLIEQLRDDLDTAAQLFAPRALRNKFFTRPLVRLALWLFGRKYRHESRVGTRDVARSALQDVRVALARHKGKNLRYICAETLTYADVVMAESLFFDPQKRGVSAYLYKDDEFAQDFPDLVAWGRAVRETHFPKNRNGEKGEEVTRS